MNPESVTLTDKEGQEAATAIAMAAMAEGLQKKKKFVAKACSTEGCTNKAKKLGREYACCLEFERTV
jgi:hypothetical protein